MSVQQTQVIALLVITDPIWIRAQPLVFQDVHSIVCLVRMLTLVLNVKLAPLYS